MRGTRGGPKAEMRVDTNTRWDRGCARSGFGRFAVALQGAGRTAAEKGSQAGGNRGQGARANRPSVSRADGPPAAFWGQFGFQHPVLSPRSSKIGAGMCADPTGWVGRSAPGLPPLPAAGRGGEASACHRRAGRMRARRGLRPGGGCRHPARAARRGLRPGRDGRGAGIRLGGIEAPSRAGAGRLVRQPGARAVEGAGRPRCRSGGGGLPGGWSMDRRSIGANDETRTAARRRQLRRRRGGSRPARGAVRPGDGPGEREGVNPARPTHASPLVSALAWKRDHGRA